jgi:hypothetical protein
VHVRCKCILHRMRHGTNMYLKSATLILENDEIDFFLYQSSIWRLVVKQVQVQKICLHNESLVTTKHYNL